VGAASCNHKALQGSSFFVFESTSPTEDLFINSRTQHTIPRLFSMYLKATHSTHGKICSSGEHTSSDHMQTFHHLNVKILGRFTLGKVC
jgi:hypothetical protein